MNTDLNQDVKWTSGGFDGVANRRAAVLTGGISSGWRSGRAFAGADRIPGPARNGAVGLLQESMAAMHHGLSQVVYGTSLSAPEVLLR